MADHTFRAGAPPQEQFGRACWRVDDEQLINMISPIVRAGRSAILVAIASELRVLFDHLRPLSPRTNHPA